MDTFEYNAPKFINFLEQSIEDNDGADTFFDCHVGDTPNPAKQQQFFTSSAHKAEPHAVVNLQMTALHTPEKDSSCASNETYTVTPESNVAARLRELDIIEEEESDINNLISNVQEISIKTPVKHNRGAIKQEKTPKLHPMSLRSDTAESLASKDVATKVKQTSCEKMKNKKVVLDEGTLRRTKLAFSSASQQDRKNSTVIETSKRKGSPLVCASSKRFVSLAEAIIRFQQSTPDRFHTQPNAKPSVIRRLAQKKHFSPPRGTIPQSPHLLTKERSRPVHYLSREALEEKEFEEIKAFHLKARPLDKKVLEPWVPPPVEKKSSTVPEPFNLTEIKKKENKPPEVFSFTANPVPKKIFEAPQGIPHKKSQPATHPVTPNVARKVKHMVAEAIVEDEHDGLRIVKKEVAHEGVPVNINHQKHATEVRPFTFEERDREMQRKKEERLQKILEEEKKAREFKANPLPSFIKSPRNTSILSMSFRKRPDPKEEEEHYTVFKARPATVLYKKPFVPEKIAHPLTDTTQIVLNTERRVKERENFEKELKEREALIKEFKRKEKERLQREEEEARAQMRKMAVHKANPIRKYKPVEVHPSEKVLTAPNSPAFYVKGKEK